MKTRLFACLLALAAAPCASGADEENPYKKAKVGDYATYKMNMKVGDFAITGTMTSTVTAKTDKSATVKVVGKVNGMDIPAQEQKIDLTKPYDPTKSAVPPGTDAKVEKLKEGKEKIKAGGKEYDCKWETYKVTGKAMGIEMTSEVKVWQAKDLPLQLVKMEMNAEFAGMKMEITMELSESGSKSD